MMQPVRFKTTPFNPMILAWLITWITTVPLSHTHLPDTTDGPASPHEGLARTIFSPDLPGEYSRSYNVTHQEHFFHVSNRVPNSPELGIALLDEETKHRKVGPPSVLILCYLPKRPPLPQVAIESSAIHRTFLVLAVVQSPRAPPSVGNS